MVATISKQAGRRYVQFNNSTFIGLAKAYRSTGTGGAAAAAAKVPIVLLFMMASKH